MNALTLETLGVSDLSRRAVRTENMRKIMEDESFEDFIAGARAATTPEEKETTLKRACTELESVFLYQLM